MSTDTLTTSATVADVRARDLRIALASVTPAASTDKMIPILGVVRIALGADVTLTATDRYVISRYVVDSIHAEGESRVFSLSRADALALGKMIPKRTSPAHAVVTLRIDGDTLTADLPSGATVTYREVDGNYPDIERVIEPRECPDSVPAASAFALSILSTLVTCAKGLSAPDDRLTFTRASADPEARKPVRVTSSHDGRWVSVVMPARVNA